MRSFYRSLHVKMDQWLDCSSGRIMIFQQIFGKFFVVYPDGKHSMIMSFSGACSYQSIFGGVVHHTRFGPVASTPVRVWPVTLGIAIALVGAAAIVWPKTLG